jgi:hypothetical protein
MSLSDKHIFWNTDYFLRVIYCLGRDIGPPFGPQENGPRGHNGKDYLYVLQPFFNIMYHFWLCVVEMLVFESKTNILSIL